MDSLTIIFILNGVFFISFFLLKNIYIPLILSLLTLFALLFISKQKKIPFIDGGFKLPSLTFNNNQYIVTIACLIIFIVLEKFIGFNATLFATFFIFAYLNKLDSRASFFIALILLVITAFLSAGGKTRPAEDIAVLVYYFLVIGVVWQMVELRQNKTQESDIPSYEQEAEVTNKSIQYNFLSNFFTKKNIIIASFIIVLFLIITFYVMYAKFHSGKKPYITSPVILPSTTLVATLSPKPLQHVPFTILNATDIRGYAGSSAATLRKAGWNDEFDISVGNYEGTASADILRY
ncbi:MAG: hypothetical protein Q7R95_04730, partial [bacterium]|nr:hypothetical protein [bacterium]